jgi:hypothetical protein
MTLAGLLLLQVVLILLVRSPLSGASAGVESRPLLPALEAFTAARVELAGEEGTKVTLVKAGEGWALEELNGFPADGGKVDDLIDDLRGLQVRRPVVTGSRYHSAFKVSDDENEGRVRIWDDPAEAPEVDLIVGSSPNYRTVHVRLGGESPVFEARDLAVYDVRPDTGSWIEKDLVDIPEAEMVGLLLANENGSFELVREGDAWRVADGSEVRGLDPDEVDALIRAARSIQLADAVGPKDASAHGLADAAATLTLRWSPSGAAAPPAAAEVNETVVRIGGKLEEQESQRYISRSGFEFTGTVWESSVSKLLEQKLDELIAEEGDESD